MVAVQIGRGMTVSKISLQFYVLFGQPQVLLNTMTTGKRVISVKNGFD